MSITVADERSQPVSGLPTEVLAVRFGSVRTTRATTARWSMRIQASTTESGLAHSATSDLNRVPERRLNARRTVRQPQGP